MNWPGRIADLVTAKPGRVLLAAGLFALVCAATLAVRLRFDTEILNLLPGHPASVQGLKEFTREFSQARELTFAVHDASGKADVGAFAEHLAATLREQPWVVRVYDRAPMESPEGVGDVRTMGGSLLLNLRPDRFAEAIRALDPDRLRQRAVRLRAELDAGSPKAMAQAEFDPLGVLAPAFAPVAESMAGDGAQPLASPDGTMRMLFVLTSQEDDGPKACQAMMRAVDAARRAAVAGWEGPAPEVLVTGRTPYVAEMSAGMEHDIAWTVAGSVLMVGGIFWLHFRRLAPLLVILHVLLLCCLAAVAAGTLVFQPLNGITVGFCSILVGLGVDFGIVLYGGYLARRGDGLGHRDAIEAALRTLGPGVVFGALTTAAGFLVLLWSQCAGFMQLGVLIAAGILFTALAMMTLLFACLREGPVPPRDDALSRATRVLVGGLAARRKTVAGVAMAVFAAMALLVVLPVGRLRIEPNPRSLEPAGSEAGRALRVIQETMTNSPSDPVLALVRPGPGTGVAAAWEAADLHWRDLVARGMLRHAVTPSALVLDPARMRVNGGALAAVDLAASARAWEEALAAAGFAPDAFPGVAALFTRLAEAAAGTAPETDWHRILPPESPWRFVLDRFFSTHSDAAVAYLSPPRRPESAADVEALRRDLAVPGAQVRLTGWSFTIADLIPWAKDRVAVLTAWMAGINMLLLFALYRRPGPTLLLVAATGMAVAATLATLKVVHVPLNLFNVLAFPLVLGVVVDYGIYVVLAARGQADPAAAVAEILKPVLLSGLTSIAGFASLGFSWNPSLSTMGTVCAIGIAWGLVVTVLVIVPLHLGGSRR